MARPVASDSEATKRRILFAANELFTRRGDGASMREIAREAGVTVGTVQHHFGTKAEVKAAAEGLLNIELAALRDELLDVLLQNPGDVVNLLRHAIRTTLRWIREHDMLVRNTMRQVVETGRGVKDDGSDVLMPLLDRGSLVLAQAAASDVERARFALLSLNHLVIRFGVTHPDELVRVMGLAPAADQGPFDEGRQAQAHDLVVDQLLRLTCRQLGLPELG